MKFTPLLIFFLLSLGVFAGEIFIEKRELTIKSFPCMNCHGNIKNSKPNFPLSKPHDELKFKHMKSIKSCFQCHDQKDRNMLVLQSGEKVSFNESQKQCFQCHGEKKRDWELGMHGKMIGSWNGDKYKSTCTSCHEPHHPKFRQMKADPGPVHPSKKKGTSGGEH